MPKKQNNDYGMAILQISIQFSPPPTYINPKILPSNTFHRPRHRRSSYSGPVATTALPTIPVSVIFSYI
ncbi:hypothetical protein QVD17_31537 [Tagetes erecta]|uniref:Uncharacterized protein n=1 Tax=Tagetes erecta TaxID=13708 RepID=A0AAD8K764_TARER|nr:hypothetical protein QVD17_31537 [Tagetes erecta]